MFSIKLTNRDQSLFLFSVLLIYPKSLVIGERGSSGRNDKLRFLLVKSEIVTPGLIPVKW